MFVYICFLAKKILFDLEKYDAEKLQDWKTFFHSVYVAW